MYVEYTRWLTRQRELKRDGELSFFNEAKLQLLVDAGVMHWEKTTAELWDNKYELLVAFGEKFGHCNVSKRCSDAGMVFTLQHSSCIILSIIQKKQIVVK